MDDEHVQNWLRASWPNAGGSMSWGWSDERETMRRVFVLGGRDLLGAYLGAALRRAVDFVGHTADHKFRAKLCSTAADVAKGMGCPTT